MTNLDGFISNAYRIHKRIWLIASIVLLMIVALYLAVTVLKHEHGHIAMYDGRQWISDFVQRDMFGGKAYRNNETACHLYRRDSGWGRRRINFVPLWAKLKDSK